jgi:uncharacterized membrane protein
MKAFFLLFAFVVFAGLGHILSLLAVPRLARADAFAWLAQEAPLHSVAVVEPHRLRSSTHIDPNFALGVCRYDLTAGPLRLRIPLSEAFTSVSFAQGSKGIFASVVEELRIKATNARGIAILSVFVEQPSARERANAALAQARCDQESLPE